MIARGVLAALSGDGDELLAYSLCASCGECVKACPESNPLPSALRGAAGILGGRRELVSTPRELGGAGRPLVIASPLRPGEGVLRLTEGWRVYWLNTEEPARVYWSGGSIRLKLPRGSIVLVEDLDIPWTAFEGEGLELLSGPRILEALSGSAQLPQGAVIHVPCKAPRELAESLSRLGAETARSCTGGGGAFGILRGDYAVEVSLYFFERFRGRTIVTPCARAARTLRRAGLNALTFLEVAVGEILER